MNSYSVVKTVSITDLDDLDHVNNVIYVQWIQDVSKNHWEKVCSGMKEHYLWVVRRHDITYYAAAKLKDEVLIATRIKDSRGSISFREVEMKDYKTNKLLVKSVTEWCLLSAETLKPIRIPETIKNLFTDT